ncbi:MAG: sodium:proton antiporter [Gammaproteobacteria bacterium]|jgi:NhaP-type Na+/H+ or K+/H+ antiporter
MTEEIILQLAGIGVIALVCQWIAWRVKLPAILFLLLAGIVAGPVTGWLQPDALFGDLLFPIIALGVAVILFEGSLTLKFDEIKGLESVVRRFVSSGVIVTWIVISVATHFILDFSYQLAFLFGAVMVVTGPTVIVPMLRTIRPNRKISNILRWEGIIVDPIGALMAVLVYEFIILDQTGEALGHTFLTFGQLLLVGVLLGILAGYLFGSVLRHHWLPEYLHNVATLTLLFGVFAVSNSLQEESGLLTVTIMGIWLANMKDVHTADILHFKESLSVLMISGLFVILAARVDFADFTNLGWGGLWVLLVIQFIARPVKVLSATWRSSLKWQEKALLSWIAPRGIVAAAIVALFAIKLEQLKFDQANLLVPLAFTVIIGTVVLQSATAGPLARLLKVAEPEPKGFLIIGANAVARAIAKALIDNGYFVQLTDSDWNHVHTARIAGLKVYYGSAVSEHADRHLDLLGIGHMLGLAQQHEYNALAATKYRREFGRDKIYTLAMDKDAMDTDDQHSISQEHRGNILFSSDATYARLAELLRDGAEIRAMALTDELNPEQYQQQYSEKFIPLFAITPRQKIIPFTTANDIDQIHPKAGWTIIALYYLAPDEHD